MKQSWHFIFERHSDKLPKDQFESLELFPETLFYKLNIKHPMLIIILNRNIHKDISFGLRYLKNQPFARELWIEFKKIFKGFFVYKLQSF